MRKTKMSPRYVGLLFLSAVLLLFRWKQEEGECQRWEYGSELSVNITVKRCGSMKELWTWNRKWGEVRQSRVNVSSPTTIVDEYAEMMALATMLHPKPRGFLNIGLGAGVLPRFFLSKSADAYCTTIEPDPAMIDVYFEHFDLGEPADDPRHRIVVQSGISVSSWSTPRAHYDVIWMDACSPDTDAFVPPHMKDDNFFSASRALLREGGLVISNSYEDTEDGWIALVSIHMRYYSRVLMVFFLLLFFFLTFPPVIADQRENRE